MPPANQMTNLKIFVNLHVFEQKILATQVSVAKYFTNRNYGMDK